MAKTKEQKKEIMKKLIEKIGQAKSMIFASFEALGVKDNEDLRKQLKAENSEYYVAKKTLLDLSLKNQEIKDIDKDIDVKGFTGRVAVVFGYQDEAAPAKIVEKFSKDHEDKIEFLGGILENKFIGKSEVEALAKLPSKLELYAKLVGSLSAPISGFANVLGGNTKKLVYALNAIADKKSNL
ncbi:MAG: 50S ribosomal protein L10 [Patescibacteria group bacterium]|nr:50S ribosomal protein L10 [Patescibacteria group bacterium]